MDDGTLVGLSEIDRKIVSAAISGVDITEVYSPERVARVAKKLRFVSGSSMDLTNGWDFEREDHKRQAWKRVREEAPYLLIRSSPCTSFSVLQELNKAVHGCKTGWTEKFDRGGKLEKIVMKYVKLLMSRRKPRAAHLVEHKSREARLTSQEEAKLMRGTSTIQGLFSRLRRF